MLRALIVLILVGCGGGDPLPEPQRDTTLEQQRPLPGGGQVK